MCLCGIRERGIEKEREKSWSSEEVDERRSEKEKKEEETKVGKPELSVNLQRNISKIKKVIRDARLSEDR